MNAMFETRSRKWKHCHVSGSSTLSLHPSENGLWNKETSLSSSPSSLCTVYQTLLSFIHPSLLFLSSLNGKYRSSMICPLASWSVMRKLHLVSPAILKEAFGCSCSQIQLYVVDRERGRKRECERTEDEALGGQTGQLFFCNVASAWCWGVNLKCK